MPVVPPAGTDVCGVDDVPLGGAIVVALGRAANAIELIVVNDRGVVRGFINICAHYPLPLNIGPRIYAADDHVHCDHHFAMFRFADGVCSAGVCVGAALTPVPLAVNGDRIQVALAPGCE
jgi:nitrite reductase/ring-hydroxylating ferredoxin subunit